MSCIAVKATFIRLVLVLLMLTPFQGTAQNNNETKEAEEEVIEGIPISEISSETEGIIKLLHADYLPVIQDSLSYELVPVMDSLSELMTEVEELTEYAIEQNFPAEIGVGFISKWDDLINKIKGPLDLVTSHIKKLEDVHKDLMKNKDLLIKTKDLYRAEELVSKEAKDRINALLTELSNADTELNDHLNFALDIQSKLTDLKLKAETELESQQSNFQKELGTMISERAEFIWNARKDSTDDRHAEESRQFFYSYNKQEAKRYLSEQSVKFYKILVIFIGFLLLLYWMISKLKEFDRYDPSVSEIGRGIFKRPFFTAMFLASISAIPILMHGPIFIILPLLLVIVTSFTLLVPVVITKKFRVPVYLFTLIYIANVVQDFMLINDHAHRFNQLALNGVLILFFVWFNRKQKAIVAVHDSNSFWLNLIKTITPLFLVMVIVGIIANILGYLYLAYLVNHTVIHSFFIAIVFGLVYSTFTAVFTLFLYTPLAEKVHLLNKYRGYIINRSKAIFKMLFIIFWLRFTLNNLHLLVPLLEVYEDFVAIGFEVDEFEITVGAFVSFAIIILFTWLLSNLVRLLLQDEILSRFNMAKGTPMAIASLTYYSLMVIGLVMALLALGFDITHLSVLAGALGLGIGFGLQNVVNNFISGLILIFERPITVGDIVNLQTIEGTVISIGIRASKVQQYDGSVLIVPNADLISNQVVNFTLTDDKRRFILPIYTDTNADPKKVLELMTEAAVGIPEVISNPPARSYFVGTEDQSRVFKLYFWVSGIIFLQTKSEVTIAVHKILEENGIKVKAQKSMLIKQLDDKSDERKLKD